MKISSKESKKQHNFRNNKQNYTKTQTILYSSCVLSFIRPQAFFVQFYMCSRLIWISPDVPRSDTLHTPPVPLDLTPPQGTRGGASPYVLPCSLDGLATALAQPIGQLLQGSPV